MTFALATIRHDGQPTPAIEVDERWYALADLAPELLDPAPVRGLMNVFEHWTEREPRLVQLAETVRHGHAGAKPFSPAPPIENFLTPLQYPTKVVLMGANYYDHMAKDAPGLGEFKKDEKIPTLFFKPPTTTLVGCGKSVRYPAQSEKFDWEGELAVVIGRRARRVSVAEALDYVAGYAVGIDLSARDWQFHPKHLVKFDLFGGKGFDDSCPFGPKITPARFVKHDQLQLKLWVNGELKQNANTSDMIWSLAEQISAMSDHVTLEPGDVILTGTPSGVGLAAGTFLKIGDKVEAEVEGLGRLSVEIVPDQPFPLNFQSTDIQPADASRELLALEAHRCRAMVAADADALDSLLSDKLTWTHSSARQDTKASFLAGLQAGGTRYLAIERSEEQVRVHGDVAVVTGLADMRASIKGEEKVLRNRYTNVWEKADGSWRMIAWQSTAVPQ